MSSISSDSDGDDSSKPSTVRTKSKSPTRQTRSRHNSPKPVDSNRSPPRVRHGDKKTAALHQEEKEIPHNFHHLVEEGWANSVKEVGIVEIKDKRSDDNTRTLLGRNLMVKRPTMEDLRGTHIRLHTTKKNCIVLTRPKTSSSMKGAKEAMMDCLEERHGECVSRNEGLNRAFARVSSNEVEHITLQIAGVVELVNTDWQGAPAKVKKEGAFYLDNHKDVIKVYDEEAEEVAPWFILSVEIPLEEGWEDVGSTDEEDDDRSDMERIRRKMQMMKTPSGGGGREKKKKKRETHKKPESTKYRDDMSIDSSEEKERERAWKREAKEKERAWKREAKEKERRFAEELEKEEKEDELARHKILLMQ